MNGQYIFTMSHLTKKIDQKVILNDVGLSFYPGAKIGVLGKNGAGKSTLLRIMAGWDKDYEGEAKLTSGFTVGYVPQEPKLDPELTVRGNLEQSVAQQLAVFARQAEIWGLMGEVTDDAEMEKLTNELGKIDEKIEHMGLIDADDLHRQLEIASDAMQLPPPDADVTKLSGGERRRVALCKILLEKPDLLLLDEPTNHLDAESVQWLEQHLQAYKGTVVAVTHDRYFLDNVAQWILEIERGRCYPCEGNYSDWLVAKQARLAIEEKRDMARSKTLARELEWIRASPKARQSKSKARVAAYEKMAAEQFEEREEEFELQIPPGKHLGELVVEFKNVSKAYGDRQLIDDLSFRLPAGGIIGVIGPNGAGKTTLFRMLVGQEAPDSGSVRLGETVQLGYVDQSRDALDPNKNIWEEISGGLDHFMVGDRKLATRSYVAKFNFKGVDQQKKVGNLSGGERNRVHLAKLLRRGCNLLLLDEPTNDLDVDTLRALEDAVTNFVGCVVCISHDRWFLDRTCTHILAFEGDGHVHWCEGGYSIYEQQRHERLGAEADQPKRFRYKKLHHG